MSMDAEVRRYFTGKVTVKWKDGKVGCRGWGHPCWNHHTQIEDCDVMGLTSKAGGLFVR